MMQEIAILLYSFYLLYWIIYGYNRIFFIIIIGVGEKESNHKLFLSKNSRVIDKHFLK